MYDAGVDVGSVSINGVVLDKEDRIVYELPYVRHFGMVYEETARVLGEILERFGTEGIRSVSFTGMHGQRIAEVLGAPYEVETIAQVLGALRVVPGVRTIIGIGGQDAALFQLAHEDGQWHLESFNMNGPCASGTGSFIDQQAERLAQSLYGTDFHMDQTQLQQVLEDFIDLGSEATYPAPVACRCTVFTKSDMIHLQNKGESLPNIVAGIHYGNAANYISTIVASRELAEPMIFIGGMASNRLQVQGFRHYFPNLRVPAHHTSLGALGAALQAKARGESNRVDLSRLKTRDSDAGDPFPRAGVLELRLSHFDPENALPPWPPHRPSPLPAYLGVDIGSTTTKYALLDEDGHILHKSYVPTRGKPIEVAQKLLKTLLREAGSRIRLRAIATTGSGRNVVGDFLGADLIIDEITAHARGAVSVDPRIDTIFEIGGQDSKYIRIEDTHPRDFDMNKVCAAGTGSFLHELSNKLKINIVGEFQDIALSAKDPVHLAERCTVFMESDLMSYAQKGARRENLVAGLCYAIVHNYLNRVVGKRFIGRRIMFLGGPSLNKGIVAAFERVLDRPILVPKHREVMGAIGAALAVRARFEKGLVQARERDLSALARMEVDFRETVCHADGKCHNECKLKVYSFGGRKSIWGGDCGRYEVSHYDGPPQADHFKERRDLFLETLEEKGIVPGETSGREGSGPVVGVPLALHSLEWGVFWARFLGELGYRVLFSPWTNGKLVLRGVEKMTAETCFPVKVFHGHVDYLLDKADLLFLPNVITMPTPHEDETGYFCPLVESSQYMVRSALKIPDERLIRPNLHLKEGPENLLDSFFKGFPRALRPARKELKRAVSRGWEGQQAFRRAVKERGREILASVSPEDPVWIVTGRPYNLYDERLNLQLGKHLAKLGIRALPMDFLELDDEDLSDFPRMYWGLGARILRAAKRILRTPNHYGVHLTNFSCGADSFIEHFYRHILQDKPSLILELDEHSAVAGVLTRVEAYRNVVKNLQEHRFMEAEAARKEVSCA